MRFKNIMSIDEMIQIAIKTKDFNAATYLTDIKKFAIDNNITINQAITHISTLNPRPYYRNLLNMLSRYYPKTNKTEAKENIENIINNSKINEHPKYKIRMFNRRN